MYILGISCYYHDAAATLLKDGQLVAAAQEERFTRKKHDTSFPRKAVAYCLKSQGIAIKDIHHIAFYEKPLLKFERVLYQHLENFPKSFKTFLRSMPSWINEKLRVIQAVRKNLGYKGDVLFIDHHMAHAASSFLASPFEEAAIVTVDGVGEWTTTTYGIGKGNDITLSKEIRFPHSLGLLYSTITAYLGFTVNNSEYKVMGLAPYGVMDRKKNPYYKRLLEVIDLKPDGSYRLDLSYFRYHYADRMPSRKLCRLLGGLSRKPESLLQQRHKDIAAAMQMVLEDVMEKIILHAYEEAGMDNLVMAGGLALNSVSNGKILKRTPFKRLWINPDPGDGGASMGAALYAYHTILGMKRSSPFINPYLGPRFSEQEVISFLEENNITYSRLRDDRDIARRAARLIHENKVVGWFQEGMEWGPRALGARSILANPLNPHMKEILNSKVKHREGFRPFAPAVCADDAGRYFQCDVPLPEPADYMLMVYQVKEEFRERLPAITHEDGSGRLQTVRRRRNPRYYDTIKEFGNLSGIPIVINTSFNIRGEPIVCSPYDAYRCMMGTGIDCLIMDSFLIRREDNLKDEWDSERLARD